MPVISRLHSELADFRRFVRQIGSMDAEQFDAEFHGRLRFIDQQSLLAPEGRRELMSRFLSDSVQEFEHGYMCRHSRTKPLGYAGDHLIIDMIYRRCTEETGIGNLLDSFYHRQKAPTAVRNRKKYFTDLMHEQVHTYGIPSVLDVACGPCRDVSESLLLNGPATFHCVDLDAQALEYARSVVARTFHDTVCWQQANALRLKSTHTYSLVWSAGLFDYLDDRQAALLLRKMWHWVSPGGEVVIGNFHLNNPDRPWMEWCGDWHLIHRDEDDMKRICNLANIPARSVRIEYEPLGVNMFLRIRK